MTEDAVIACHTALEFQRKAYSIYEILHYVSVKKSSPLRHQSYEIRGVPVPYSLRRKGRELFGITRQKRSGVELRVINIERILVDIFDRLNLTESWEEIWRSLQSVEFFDLDQVIEYALLLGNVITAAKVGFFLE